MNFFQRHSLRKFWKARQLKKQTRIKIGDSVQQSWPGEGGQGPIYKVIGFDKRGWLILDDGDTVHPNSMLAHQESQNQPDSPKVDEVLSQRS